MKHPRHSFLTSALVFITAMAAALLPTLATSRAATPLDANLIVNGDGEASPGAANYSDVLPPTGWTTTSNFTVVRYPADNHTGQLSDTQSATFGGGANFFAGGPNNADSSATQTIDISDRAADIDSGQLSVVLSGFFGGVSGQDDGMTLGAQLLNDKGQQYAATLIGNVQSAERQGASGLLYRSRNLPVPVGIRSIKVTLRATRANTTQDTYNDGYADNVSLELVKTGGVNTFAQSFGNPFDPTNDTGPGLDYTNGIAPMPDGGVVVVGVVGKNFHNAAADDVLIRYGADGKILWQKEFPDSGKGYAVCLVTTDPQGNVYFASAFHGDANNATYPFVAKFDVNGVQQWFTNVQVPVSDVPNGYTDQNSYINSPFTGMYLSPDGNLLLGTGLLADTRNGVTIPAIVTVNAATGAVSCLGLDTSSPRVDTTAGGPAFSLCRSLTSGNMAFLTISADRGYELVLVDASGKPVATRESVGGPYAFMIPAADGGFLVINGGIVQKFGADLTLQFQKIESDFQPFSVVQTPDGGYLLSARASVKNNPNYTGNKVFLVKLDSQGRLDRAEALGGLRAENANYYSSFPSTAVLTTDGGIGLATMTTSYTADTTDIPDWWVVKADKLGRIANFQDLMVDVSTQIQMRDATAQNFPPPGNGIAFDKPKSFAINNPTKPTLGPAIPQSLNSTDPSATVHVQAQAAFPAPPPPPHGGVGGTDFTVNGSYTVFKQNIPDTVLHFAAGQTSHAAGLFVRVQATTTPTTEASWTDLPNGNGGFMTYNASTQQFILSSTNYPIQNGVYFRAIAAAPGYPDSISNVVGPFNLASNQSHLGPTKLYISKNGPVANIRFGVTEATIPSGIDVHIQATNTPASEASWQTVSIGVSGRMDEDTAAPHEFYLGSDDYPSGEGVYFRAIATAPGSVDSTSSVFGPFTFILDPAPTIALTVSVPNGTTSGSGTLADPIVVSSRSFNVTAKAQSGRQIKHLALKYDGDTLQSFDGAANDGNTVLYTTNIPGDHLIEATATDDLKVVGDATPLHLRVSPGVPGNTFTMIQSGDWSTAGNWHDSNGNIGVPGTNDFAVLGANSASLSRDITVNAVSLNGGIISGPGVLNVTGFLTIAAGKLSSNVNIAAGAVAELINDLDIGISGHVTVSGTWKMHGKGGITGIKTGTAARSTDSASVGDPNGLFDGFLGAITNFGNWLFHRPAGGRAGSGSAPPPPPNSSVVDQPSIIVSSVINQGQVKVVSNDGGSVISNDGGSVISNDGGSVVSHDGGSLITNDGGTLIGASTNVVSHDGGSVVSHDGGSFIGHDGTSLVATGGGNLVATGGGNFKIFTGSANSSQANSPQTSAAAANGTYSQSAGETDMTSISIVGAVSLNGGVLTGSGVIQGDLTNNGGYISPGHSPGLLAVTGSFTQGANGTLIVENGGPYPSQFDQLQVGGVANLGGKLDIKTINGYVPDPADTFSPLGYSSVSGSFSSISSNAQVTANPSGLLTSVDPMKLNPPSGQPANISTRMKVLTNDKVLIGGFIVTGPTGSTKKVLIRGMGPTLAKFGVPGVLSDPFIELHYPDSTPPLTNDDWMQAANHDQIPQGFQPDPKEAALLVDLPPGAYTVIEKGAHGETGVGLTEVYDFDGSSAVALANISTRGFIDTDDNVMIGGFIVSGSEPAQILVRGTGPSLAQYGISGALADPVLELHDANGNVILNDDWRETQETEIIATTIPPANDKEPAILVTLVPGSYTAIVRGKDNTTGVGLVEAYKIK